MITPTSQPRNPARITIAADYTWMHFFARAMSAMLIACAQRSICALRADGWTRRFNAKMRWRLLRHRQLSRRFLAMTIHKQCHCEQKRPCRSVAIPKTFFHPYHDGDCGPSHLLRRRPIMLLGIASIRPPTMNGRSHNISLKGHPMGRTSC